MEAVQRQKLQLRREFLDALQNHYDDIDAIYRVNAINKVSDDPDMVEKNLERYPVLTENGYLAHFPKDADDINYYIHFIYAMQETDKEYRLGNGKKFERSLRDNELWVKDIIWSDVELCNYVRFMRKFGYDRMVLTSTACSATKWLTDLVEMGAKIIDVNRYIEYSYDNGLVIDITSIDLAGWICFHKMPRLKKNETRNEKLIKVFTEMFELVK